MDESASLRSLRSQVQILPGSYEISNLRFQIPKRRSGGTGRRAASRASWETFPWRFKSSHPHQTLWGAGMADREDAADLKLVGGALWPVGGDGYHAGLSIQRPRVRFPHRPLRSMVDVAQSGERRSVAPEAPGSIPAIHPRFGDAIPQRSGWRCLASASPGWPEAGIRERSSRMSTLRQGEERGFKSRRLRQKWIGNSGGQSTCLLSRESWVRIPPDPLLLPL